MWVKTEAENKRHKCSHCSAALSFYHWPLFLFTQRAALEGSSTAKTGKRQWNRHPCECQRKLQWHLTEPFTLSRWFEHCLPSLMQCKAALLHSCRRFLLWGSGVPLLPALLISWPAQTTKNCSALRANTDTAKNREKSRQHRPGDTALNQVSLPDHKVYESVKHRVRQLYGEDASDSHVRC